MEFENKLQLNNGIYTLPEIAKILRLPYHTVSRWVKDYWDGKLGKAFSERYSWMVDGSRAVSFHTLVELTVLMRFSEVGVKTSQVLKAHELLTQHFNTAFPFATRNVLANLRSDGKWIYLQNNENLLSLDGSQQLKLQLIETFFKNLDFDDDFVAQRFWPLGRDRQIVIDPKRKFGQPVLVRSNISPDVLAQMYKAGDPVPFLASLYEITEAEVEDAILFCQAA